MIRFYEDPVRGIVLQSDNTYYYMPTPILQALTRRYGQVEDDQIRTWLVLYREWRVERGFCEQGPATFQVNIDLVIKDCVKT